MIEWVAGLGFTGVALGPAGITGRTNPSPYDATALSRNPLHIALGPLCEQGLLDERLLDAAVAKRPPGERVAVRLCVGDATPAAEPRWRRRSRDDAARPGG